MNNSHDIRLDQLTAWLRQIKPHSNFHIEPASSDASFRRYFRIIEKHQTLIIMDAPPEHENLTMFINVAEFLYQHDIQVPQIFEINLAQGFLLLSDFGKTSYLSALNADNADEMYQAAIDELIAMQLTPAHAITLPPYNDLMLNTEMALFPDWFLQRHLQIEIPEFLPAVFELLTANAIEQPQTFVHRDYHSRNLMKLTSNKPGIIDFQDAVIGPISYDLVSLLRDCYIHWPDDKIEQWIRYYFDRAVEAGLLPNISQEQFKRWFDLMGLQRHIKVLGIFCRLNYRDNKYNYMNNLPLTMHYVREVSKLYPELKQLHDFVTSHPDITASI